MTKNQHVPRNWRASPALTLTEAAAVLGVSRSRAYEMAQTGELPTQQDHLGRRRVKPSDLEPLLAAQADDQPDLFAQDSHPRTRALRRRQARLRPFGLDWLEAVLADPRTDPETAEVARWLASVAAEDGTLSADTQHVLQQALEGA